MCPEDKPGGVSRLYPVRTEQDASAESSAERSGAESTEPCAPAPSAKRKRLQRARHEVAEIVDEMLDERWASGDNTFSNRAIAERLLDVDEATVRKWRDGDKPVPLAALLCLPLAFGEDIAERILSARRELAGDRRAVIALGRAVTRVDKYALHAVFSQRDREGLVKALRSFSDELLAIATTVEETR